MIIRSVSYNRKTGEFEYGQPFNGHHAYPIGYHKEILITDKEFFTHYNSEAELDLFPEEENEIIFTREEIEAVLLDNWILPFYSNKLQKLSEDIAKAVAYRHTFKG